jgi:hypothetical protein
LHACTAVRRGRRWQGLWYLERVRNRTLKLAQERRGYYAEFFDYVDDLPLHTGFPCRAWSRRASPRGAPRRSAARVRSASRALGLSATEVATFLALIHRSAWKGNS